MLMPQWNSLLSPFLGTKTQAAWLVGTWPAATPVPLLLPHSGEPSPPALTDGLPAQVPSHHAGYVTKGFSLIVF